MQSFPNLVHRPLIVDLTVEDNQRLKVIYGSVNGFHAIDLDSASVQDIYSPPQVGYRDRERGRETYRQTDREERW